MLFGLFVFTQHYDLGEEPDDLMTWLLPDQFLSASTTSNRPTDFITQSVTLSLPPQHLDNR